MSLLERNSQAPETWNDTLPVTNRYTYGPAGERFFRALKEAGIIYGTHCPNCDLIYVPARLFCERCLSELTEWIDVGLIGELHTYTLLYINYDGSRREVPEVVVFIKFGDGGLVHKLCIDKPDDIQIGMPVEAVLKPAPERQGSILDILCFKPVAE
jgi:uncharacterized OB-fold protein